MKIKLENILTIKRVLVFIIAFFSVVIFSISNFFILNFAFLAYFTYLILSDEMKIRVRDKKSFFILFVYYLWIFIDFILVLFFRNYDLSFRNVIQLMMECQYVFLLLELKFDYYKLCSWMIKITRLYSIVVIVFFFFTETYKHLANIFGIYREWGIGYFPGGTTDASVTFVFVLFLAFYYNESLVTKLLITIGGLLFPSRISLIGLFLIWGYFLLIRLKSNIKLLIGLCAVGCVFCIPGIYSVMNALFPDMMYRLTVSWDRLDIFKTFCYFAKKHWLTGYGGRTLNQLYDYYAYIPDSGWFWPHTHNFVFEEWIRYGMIGTILFCIVIFMICKKMPGKNQKFMMILFIIMGLFQIYFREFYFLFYIMILSNLKGHYNDSCSFC